MANPRIFKIIIAETAPIILNGLIETLKKISEIRSSVIGISEKESLIQAISTERIDLLIVNPIFGGLLHPDEVRKSSLNPDIKIFAIEISRLNRATLSLYDNHVHVTEDFSEIKNKVIDCLSLTEEEEEKENLSTREKEIISLVVKGMTNQEIADKLFLSVHTVMTHRRNIAKKLQIHSATGLTIYAIVNKIVDLSDIKL